MIIFEILKLSQMDIMLSFSSICGIVAFFVHITKGLSAKRKNALLMLETSAMILLAADRLAYLYNGDISSVGFIMVRISNFLVFTFTVFSLHAFNLYLSDLLTTDGMLVKTPPGLRLVNYLLLFGELLIILNLFTGLYYTFDDSNRYQRSDGYIISYLFPFAAIILQLLSIIKYYSRFNKKIRFSLFLFAILPPVGSLIQLFNYGVSITNFCAVVTSVSLYVFILLDMNDARMMIGDMKEKVNAMGKIAYKDALTGLGNRAAYDETAKMLDRAITAKDGEYPAFSFIMIDLNCLKTINDKYGHECGNIYLESCAHMIGGIFGDENAYRYGGDEFVVIMIGVSEEKVEALTDVFKHEMKKLDEDQERKPWEKVSAAAGIAVFDNELDKSSHDVFKRADHKMYENKIQMKAARNS